MPMLRVCAHPDCSTRTLGEFCLEHEKLEPPAKREGTDVAADLQAVAARSASPSATYAEAETER